MKSSRRFRILLIASIVGVIIVAAILLLQQVIYSQKNGEQRIDELFSYIDQTFQQQATKINETVYKHIDPLQTQLNLVAESLKNTDISSGTSDDRNNGSAYRVLRKFDSLYNDMNLCLVDTNGSIIYRHKENEDDYDAVELTDNFRSDFQFSDEEWNRFIKGTALNETDETSSYMIPDYYKHQVSFGDYTFCFYVYCSVIKNQSGNDSGYRLVAAEEDGSVYLNLVNTISTDFIYHLDGDIQFVTVYESGFIDYLTAPECFQDRFFPETGLSEEILEDGYSDIVNLSGTSYQLKTRTYTNSFFYEEMNEYSIIALKKVGISIDAEYIVLDCVIFLLAVLLFLFFGYHLHRERTNDNQAKCLKMGHFQIDLTRARELLPIGTVLLIAAIGLSYITTTLSFTSSGMRSAQRRQEGIENELAFNYQFQQMNLESLENSTSNSAKFFLELIYSAPNEYLCTTGNENLIPYYSVKDNSVSPITDNRGMNIVCSVECSKLKDTANQLGFSEASVYSEDLLARYTTKSFKPESISSDSPFIDVLLCNTADCTIESDDNTVQYALPMDLYYRILSDDKIEYIDADEYTALQKEECDHLCHTKALMIVTLKNASLQTAWSSTEELLEKETAFGTSYMLFLNDDNHTTVFIPASFNGHTAQNLNLPERLFQTEGNSFAHIEGKYYLLNSVKQNEEEYNTDLWFITAVDTSVIYQQRLASICYTGGLVLAFFLLISFFVSIETRTAVSAVISDDYISVNDSRGAKKILLHWNQKKHGEKFAHVVFLIMDLLLVYLLLMYLLKWRNADSNDLSAISWLFSGKWDRGVNVFSVTTVLILICTSITLGRLLTKIMNLPYQFASGRIETCLKLAGSIVRYAIILFSIFYSLYLFGMDTAAVLKSLGVFSAVIALGANKLIGDIVAGIFIIFEGEFRVGDIVTIDNFCGRVTEIGIRTTKLENLDGNVNIYTNSSISKVLNMSHKPSRIKIDLQISKEISVDTFERCFYEYLPNLCRSCNITKESLNYLGVDQFTGGYNTFRIEMQCSEIKRNTLFRKLNRELLLMCKKYNLPIK